MAHLVEYDYTVCPHRVIVVSILASSRIKTQKKIINLNHPLPSISSLPQQHPEKNIVLLSQYKAAIIFPDDIIVLAFFGGGENRCVHCFLLLFRKCNGGLRFRRRLLRRKPI